jgi:hypothetical protein
VEDRFLLLVDPVQYERVEVQVRVQRRAERLLERHRPTAAVGEARGVAVVREHRGQERGEYLAAQLAVPREPEPQRHGKRKDPLRTGTPGKTLSTRCAAPWFMRRPVQLGQNPRCLHENATARAVPQPSQRSSANPCSGMPHTR